VDVVIVPEARLDIRAVCALGPAPETRGILLGRKTASRFYVERVFPAPPTTAPSSGAVDALDPVWEGRIIGLFAVRPGRDVRRAVLAPRFYGKLLLDLRPRKKGPEVRAYAVRHDGDIVLGRRQAGQRFFLSPLPLGSGAKGGTRERTSHS
jgi:hypothetical protein